MVHLQKVATAVVTGQAECLRLLCEVAATVTSGLTIPSIESYELLAASYLEKQIEHSRGILLLGAHPDARLIGRAMMEVHWQLDWAAKDPEPRAWRWAMFSYIKDWRTILYREAKRETVPDDEKEPVLAWISEFGKEFAAPRPRRLKLPGGGAYQDPYVLSWHGMSVAALAREAGDYEEYLRGYSVFSDRVHSDTAEIARSIQLSPGQVLYVGASPEGQAAALNVGYEYLWRTALVVDKSLARGRRDDIVAVGERYRAVGEAAGLGTQWSEAPGSAGEVESTSDLGAKDDPESGTPAT